MQKSLSEENNNLHPLLDFMVSDFFPEPQVEEGENFQMLVTNLSYSNYLGAQVIGRIHRGAVKKHQQIVLCDKDGQNKGQKITNIQIFDALGTREVQEAKAGEIVILSGIDNADDWGYYHFKRRY